MRITVVGPSFPFRGGIAHYTSLLCASLAEKHEVRLVSLSRQYPRLLFPGKTQTDESESKLAFPDTERLIDSMNPISWFTAAQKIRQQQPDLVIIQWWHPFFAPAFGTVARLCRKFSKVMFTCHNVLPHEQSGPVRFLTNYALSKGDFFIVHSDEDATNLKSLLPNPALMKARHPTYEVFASESVAKNDARKQLGLGAEEKVLLFFGLIREYKGLRYLIEAMPSILKSLDVTLLIAGEFYDSRDKYVQLIKDLGIESHIRLKDKYIPNEEVGVYFAASDLVVLPYISATQSGIVQIAYGFDKPVVTTDVGGLPEAVPDGHTGFVVPPEDPNALAQAVIRFFNENRSEEFTLNIQEFRKEFSWAHMVETIEKLALDSGGCRC